MTKTQTPLSIAKLRHKAFKQIRDHFDKQDFIEIDAPILISANAVEAFIDPIEAIAHDVDGKCLGPLYLHTSPEIHMKRLLAHGAEKIYFLGHVFRDREASPIHLTEFMMLEWYEAPGSLDDLIGQCEKLFRDLNNALSGSDQLFEHHFDRVSVASAWEKFADIDLEKALAQIASGDQFALVNAVTASGETLRPNADFDDAFTHIMVKKVEPQIGQNRPCVLYDWPAQTAALSRLSPVNPLFAQRFEIYCRGLELANAFAELTDPIEQRARFLEANATRIANSRSPTPIDEQFLAELANIPSACGIAVGIDRLIALIHGKRNLAEVLNFKR